MASSIERWNNLISNKQYSLKVLEVSTSTTLTFTFTLTGAAIDSMASNLPMSVQNTVLNPASTINVVAG